MHITGPISRKYIKFLLCFVNQNKILENFLKEIFKFVGNQLKIHFQIKNAKIKRIIENAYDDLQIQYAPLGK